MMQMEEMLQKAAKVKLLILDVDGVLTDGTIYLTESGEEFKAFNSKDGIGLKTLIKSGVEVAIISGRKSAAVEHRLQPLGVRYIHQGHDDKIHKYNELKEKLTLRDDEIAYIGDDLPDLPPIKTSGLGIVVADGNDFARQHADWITSKPGGRGAVREVCEHIMRAQNNLDKMQQYYLPNE